MCVLYPQAVEGPFYFDPKLVREDITDGRPGLPLRLTLRIVDHSGCGPITGARVDVWHADAGGVYSGYARQGDDGATSTKGESYLRGTQISDAAGTVRFRSVYPGWYPGRTPHIHFKVILDDKTVATAQAYFTDALSARVYTTTEPYKLRPKADTTNENDFIYRAGAKESGSIVFTAAESTTPIEAGLLVSIDRTGEAARNSGGLRGFMRSLFGR